MGTTEVGRVLPEAERRYLGHRVIDLTTLRDGTKSHWRFNAGG